MLRQRFAVVLLIAATALCSLLSGCSDRERTNLLDLVPENASAIVSLYPEQAFKVSDTDRRSDSFKQQFESVLDRLAPGLTAEQRTMLLDFINGNAGVSFDQWVFATLGQKDARLLVPVEDRDKFIEYMRGSKQLKESEAYDHLCWYKADTEGIVVYDSDLLVACLVLDAETVPEASKAYNKLVDAARATPLADWQRKRLEGDDRLLGALVNLNALGMNVDMLRHTPFGELFVPGAEYLAASATSTKKLAALSVTALNAKGQPTDIINPSLAQGTDFSAADLLPDDLHYAMSLGVGLDKFQSLLPESELEDPTLRKIVDNVKSIAVGLENPDGLSNMTNGDLKGAIAIKFTPGSQVDADIRQLPGFQGEGGFTQMPDGGLKYSMPYSDVTLYLYSRPDAMLISSKPTTFGSPARFKAPADALLAFWSNQAAHGIKDAHGALTPSGFEYTVNIDDIKELTKYYQETYNNLLQSRQ